MEQNNYIKKIKQDGFVIIRNIVKREKIQKILSELPNIEKKASKLKRKYYHKTNDGKGNTIHNINEFVKSGEIIKLSKDKKIIHLVQSILKDVPVLRNIEFFLKPKKNKMLTPFHQDNFYWNIIGANAVNVWIACSNTSRKNGGICYLKKSHKIGTIKHIISYVKGTSQKIPNTVLKKLDFKKIYPKVNIGDLIVHNCEVIHGSSKNLSNKDRIGLVFSYKGLKSRYDNLKIKKYKLSLKKNMKKIYN